MLLLPGEIYQYFVVLRIDVAIEEQNITSLVGS